MSGDEWESKFYSMLDHVEELQFDMVQEWLGEDEFRIEALASALARDEIIYYMSGFSHDYKDLHEGDANKLLVELPESEREFPFRDYMYNDVKGYGRVIWFKKFLYDFPEHYRLRLDAPSLKKWLNKTFPLEPAPQLEPEQEPSGDHGSGNEKLAFAAECYKAIYPNGYKLTGDGLKKQYDHESSEIKKYLEKSEIRKRLKKLSISGRAKDALIVQLNPVKK